MLLESLKRYVPIFLKTTLKLFLTAILFFILIRVSFFFFLRPNSFEIEFNKTVIQIFLIGFLFDTVVTMYGLIVPMLILFIDSLLNLKSRVLITISKTLLFIFFALYTLICAANFPYFQQFGNHLSYQAFLWASSPVFVLKLIFGHISYYGYLLLFALSCYTLFYFINNLFKHHINQKSKQHDSKLKLMVVLVLITFPVIVALRGRLSFKSTLHEGVAIVGVNSFTNQVALNPVFTLIHSTIENRKNEYQVPSDIDASFAFVRNYFGIKNDFTRNVNRLQNTDSAFKPYNVVFVCMESMSRYKMGIHGWDMLTPNLNELIKESVFFDRFFSSGIHTFNGLFSSCSGYPSTLKDHCLNHFVKKPFTTLGNLLLKKNYETYFFSTHDPHFDNMQGFFTLNGFNKFYSSFDLPSDKSISITGIPDHELFNLFIDKINTGEKNKPFMAFLMTGSDHGPWKIPDDIPFKPDAKEDFKRSTQYADWAIGNFMENVKKQPWYDNTLFVFFGDHGSYIGPHEMQIGFHHIPLIIHKPNSLIPDTIFNLGYQPDLTATVAGMMNLSFENSTFGIDLFREKHSFVCFTADNKIGCVTDDGYFFHELLNQKTKRLKKYFTIDEKDYYELQKPLADSLQRITKKFLDASEYILRNDYHRY